jgi:hypothetical protein
MGLEIAKIFIKNINEKSEIKDNLNIMPKEKDVFFNYLKRSLKNAKKLSFRNINFIEKPINNPRIFNEIRDIITIKEINFQKSLTQNEKILYVSEWKGWEKNKTRKYLEAMDREYISKFIDDNNTENNIFDIIVNKNSPFNSEEYEYFIKQKRSKICNAVEYALRKVNDNRCCRALLTLYCFKNMKDNNWLNPVLDKEILELCQKCEKLPTKKEIYFKYHSNITDKSAEASSSRLLTNFFTELSKYIKNNPEYLE